MPAQPFPFQIKRGDNTKLSPHFLRSEFFSNSPDAPAQHPIYPQLVAAAEILRTYFNTPWRITSTYRTEAHERRILASLKTPFFISQHMKGKAFDSQPANRNPAILATIAKDFIAGGELYQKLRAAGITAFGLYDTFIHLDCRNDEFAAQRKDAFGFVAHWDSRTGVKKSWGGAFLAPNATPRPLLAENQGAVLHS